MGNSHSFTGTAADQQCETQTHIVREVRSLLHRACLALGRATARGQRNIIPGEAVRKETADSCLQLGIGHLDLHRKSARVSGGR